VARCNTYRCWVLTLCSTGSVPPTRLAQPASQRQRLLDFIQLLTSALWQGIPFRRGRQQQRAVLGSVREPCRKPARRTLFAIRRLPGAYEEGEAVEVTGRVGAKRAL
jgi:hypothetical protein